MLKSGGVDVLPGMMVAWGEGAATESGPTPGDFAPLVGSTQVS